MVDMFNRPTTAVNPQFKRLAVMTRQGPSAGEGLHLAPSAKRIDDILLLLMAATASASFLAPSFATKRSCHRHLSPLLQEDDDDDFMEGAEVGKMIERVRQTHASVYSYGTLFLSFFSRRSSSSSPDPAIFYRASWPRRSSTRARPCALYRSAFRQPRDDDQRRAARALDESLESAALTAAATAACAAQIELLPTPVVLTARALASSSSRVRRSSEYADDGDDEETEEALVLAELTHEGVEVLIVQTLDPLYVVGKRRARAGSMPTDNEIDAVSDTIEQLVIEFEDGFEGDDDEFDV